MLALVLASTASVLVAVAPSPCLAVTRGIVDREEVDQREEGRLSLSLSLSASPPSPVSLSLSLSLSLALVPRMFIADPDPDRA